MSDSEYADEGNTSLSLNTEWTEDKCLHLIREYRMRPVLWSPKDYNYYKPLMKQQAWEEIGNKLGYTAEACKNKMNILLSSFRREKSKIVRSVLKGNGMYF